jgi:SNF2 family DNA or RNA helicase
MCAWCCQFPFQQQALAWMLMREGAVPWPAAWAVRSHPLWRPLSTGPDAWVNPWSGAVRATPPPLPPQQHGGILAEAMGLGKTVRAAS